MPVYDTTNFHTYIARNNELNSLGAAGHNKQGRHNLRQAGLSYVLDGDHGLSLCHPLYPGNVADAAELPEALKRVVALLDRNQIARDSMLGISLLQYVRCQAQAVWPGLSTEQLLDELRQIQKYVLLYPPQGEKGPNRLATVLSKQSLPQQRLAEELGLNRLCST